MKTILDITTILSQDLKSRFAVNDLFLYIKNAGSESIVIDFANVKFATRSFVDEYHFGAWKERAKELFEKEDEESAVDFDAEKYKKDEANNAINESWLPISTKYYLFCRERHSGQ